MPKVLSLPPLSHIKLMFRDEIWQTLNNEFEVWQNPEPRHAAPTEVLDRLADCEAILTGWGAQPFTRETLEAAPQLKIVAHTAGSVKSLFSQEIVREVLLPRGIVVFSGNAGLAVNVAEATIGSMIMAARLWPQHMAAFKTGCRQSNTLPNNRQYLLGATVGLVSASKVARHVVRLLQPFECRILMYDPFLTKETAHGLGVELAGLDDIFKQSDIVSLHAPALPATEKMIGAAQLRQLRDGATFINNSRGAVLDHDALLDECRTGRIVAVLDVTTPEPLPPDSEFWQLSNVMLTPHIAGTGAAGYFRIGYAALQALRDYGAGRPIAGAAPLESWDILA